MDIKGYQKPELTQIDDPDFDETGQGSSYVNHGNGNNGNHNGWNQPKNPHHGH